MVAEKEEASTVTASLGQDEIGGIRDNAKNHITGVVANDGIGMGGEIIEKVIAGFACDFSWLGLAWLDCWKFR